MLKKGLSQHLLKDTNLLRKMVRLAGIGGEDAVVEIGPGQGDLTRCIAEKARFVYAIEVDRAFGPFLQSVKDQFPNTEIIFSDVIAVSFSELSGRLSGNESIVEPRITVMGNIPYRITGDILFKLLYEKSCVTGAYLTMQREVAERLTSDPRSRSYGALSVIFQLYAAVRVLLTIKPGLFIPPPKVESSYISIIFDQRLQVDRGLVDFVKACFLYKRKYLKHSLERRFSPEQISGLYRSMEFSPSIRAEEIEPHGFRSMYEYLGRET